MMERQVPVLVVGGSLVGLTTSVLLADHGVPHLLVEGHRGTAIHPCAASFHQGTMEVFRSVGLQEPVERAAAGEVQRLVGVPIAAQALAGPNLAGTVLVRPDGVIAWRTEQAAAAGLTHALLRLLRLQQ